MIDIEFWIAFIVASTVLLIIPGPTIMTVISYSLSHGNRAKLPLVLAVALGDSTALVLSLLGVGALLEQSAYWFQMIKWMGGLYLLYLGIKLIRTGITHSVVSTEINKETGTQLFINTYLVTALNPKGIIFFVAFLPQFINAAHSVSPQLWVLASTFVLLATINATLYALFAGKARQLLASPKAQRIFNFSGGGLLSCAGLYALTARQ